MKRHLLLILSFVLFTIAIFAKDKKYIKDLDNDNKNDNIILHYNEATEIFEGVEINCTQHGKFEYYFKQGIDYVPNHADYIFNNANWDVRNFDMFYMLIFNKKAHYLIFYENAENGQVGQKLIIKIGFDSYSVLFDKPFEIDRILPDDNSVNIFGRNRIPEAIGDTVIANTEFEILYYIPFLCYNFMETENLDIEKSISYNQKYYVGWAKSERRKVIRDKKSGNQKFLFETYRKYPETSLRKLSESELKIYSSDELRLMRNEIFADYGYSFSDEYLSWYFKQFDWYREEDKNVESDLSEIEIANINLIRSLENK